MFVAWGPQLTLLYNDACVPLLGRKHPAALGQPLLDVWAEARDQLLPLHARVAAGEAVCGDDITLRLDRGDGPTEAHFAYSCTPVHGGDGAVAGSFCVCTETTHAVLAKDRREQDLARMAQMFDQGPSFMAVLAVRSTASSMPTPLSAADWWRQNYRQDGGRGAAGGGC